MRREERAHNSRIVQLPVLGKAKRFNLDHIADVHAVKVSATGTPAAIFSLNVSQTDRGFEAMFLDANQFKGS